MITNNTKLINLTEDQLVEVITMAFSCGEQWGVCYSQWFTPSEDDQRKKLKEAVVAVNDLLKQ